MNSRPLAAQLYSCFALIGFCLWLLVPTTPGWSQVESGRIVGTVHDTSGAAIPGATVNVENTDTNIRHTVETNATGQFVVTQLQPGTYTAIVEHPGFQKVVEAPFQLTVSQVVTLDIGLTIGRVDQVVNVTASEPLLESGTSSVGQVITAGPITSLPLNGRDFIQLAYLTPGVNQGPSGIVQQGSIPENERGNGAIQANGLNATNNNFLLDGFDNNEQQIGFELIQPSVDAIAEFKMQTSSFAADIGKGGAVVNVALKSGTNQFHGDAFEFVRNSAFDSKNYFDSGSAPIPPFKQNQFGGTLGGPILKNRTFFFVDYQGTRINQSQTVISTVPPQAERTGDFSDLLTGVTAPNGYDTGQIYDPSTYNPVTNTRTPFPGNIIPQASLNPAALNVAALYPAANLSGTANNYLSNPALVNNQDSFDIRVDHQLTSKDSFFATFEYGNVNETQPDPFPGEAGGGSFSGHISDLALAAGISDVHTFAANKINEFKVGYMRYVVNAIPFFAGEDLSTPIGIPGIFDPENAVATGGLPSFAISGLSNLGNQDWFPELLRENNYQYLDSFTYIRGSHSFKVGVDIRRRLNGFDQTQNARGDFSFDQQFTEDLVTGTGGAPLASFLLGYPISAARYGQKGLFGLRWLELGAYAMNDYRVTPRLTLNLGLRWDLYTPYVEQYNRLANFDFATGEFIAPGMPGVSRTGNVETPYKNFAPRVGFAWTPHNGPLAIRGGFGIFYDLQGTQGDSELPYNPTGLFYSQSFNYPASTPGLLLSQGFPPRTYPTIENPSGAASAVPFRNPTTSIEEWNLNVEQQVGKDSLFQIAYVGTHGVHLSYVYNLNQAVEPLDSNFGPAPNYGRPYYNTVPDIAAIRTNSNLADSITHQLQAKFEKRLTSNWSTLVAYTWQHTIGQTAENEWAGPQNVYNLRAERGDQSPDFRNQFTSAWSYNLPFGPGQRFLHGSGLTRIVAGGWQSQGIIAFYSGQAITPALSFDPTNTSSGAPRPDVIGNPYNFTNATGGSCSGQQTILCWFNPGAYAIPSLAPGQTFATNFGDAGVGTLRGPAQYNVDTSIFKDFKLRESLDMQFRAEAFNVFNHPQFATPNPDVDTSQAGTITSTVHSARQLQFAFKFLF
jgi:Carboxypeptidase regulatory-like domain